jgi:hypothetical protein
MGIDNPTFKSNVTANHDQDRVWVDRHLRAHPRRSLPYGSRNDGEQSLRITAFTEGGYLIAYQDDGEQLPTHPEDAALTKRRAGMDGRTIPQLLTPSHPLGDLGALP